MRIDTFWNLILGDLSRYQSLGAYNNWGKIQLVINAFLCKDHRLCFQFWHRFLSVSPPRIIRIPIWILYNRVAKKYHLQIPVETKIGRGLYLGHGICIVINGNTVIGKNCSLSQFLTIGSNKCTPAVIGDNVYIGPGVNIVENVRIGSNVKIGAGTVVINDIPNDATSVGNPNRIKLNAKNIVNITSIMGGG